ncbi:hypothetical protein RB195_022812 [Necator americanus]|uniref:Uncharacterized protein n=1 Tax=Necator americanus TaxID=51031 RepID=A0ABR1EGN7_NECAM
MPRSGSLTYTTERLVCTLQELNDNASVGEMRRRSEMPLPWRLRRYGTMPGSGDDAPHFPLWLRRLEDVTRLHRHLRAHI